MPGGCSEASQPPKAGSVLSEVISLSPHSDLRREDATSSIQL